MNPNETLTANDALRLRQMAEQLNNVADVLQGKAPPPLKLGRVHELKCHKAAFEAMLTGAKPFEFRKDDRGFEVGDILVIKEWEQSTAPSWTGFTGRETLREVTYILRGNFGMPAGYVCMGVREVLAAWCREKLDAVVRKLPAEISAAPVAP